MAYSKNEKPSSDYNQECKLLKANGPDRLYLINGQEDYLSDYIFEAVKVACIPEGDNGFNYKKFDEYDFNADNLSAAVDSMPFLSDRTLVVARNVDINGISSEESEKVIKIISDIPDYCTLVFMFTGDYQFDGRLKLTKKLKESAHSIYFATQGHSQLIGWVKRRFAAWNKRIELEAIETLLLISGEKMKDLIPEIDKIAAYSSGDAVTVSDVQKVANHIPSAVVFDVIDKLAGRDYNGSLSTFSEYTNEHRNSGIASLGLFSSQFRKLYMIKYCSDYGGDSSAVKKTVVGGKDFIYNKLLSQSRAFSIGRLKKIINSLAEADYACKSTGDEQNSVAVNTLIDIIGGVVQDDKDKRSNIGRGQI